MKATTLTPAEIFGNQIRYVVPLYQRPYVWTKDTQWQPLWDDVSALADRVLETPDVYGAPPVPPHFLGAIVIDQVPGPVTHIGTRSVIDGQQRLTTLQLLLDAAQSVVEQHGRPVDASALRVIVENNSELAIEPDHVYKVWPTDRDQDAYRAAMRDDVKPAGDLVKATIAQAHAFFEAAVFEWAKVDEAPVGAGERLAALTNALREKLRLVVIDLEPGDNAQVIFETLNHRGSPLLAADLVKNLMFQVAAAQGLDIDTLYKAHWRELDSDYWRQRVAQGRRFQPRIDVFMHRWLVMNLRRDVPTDRVFTEFRDSIVSKPGVDIAGLFEQIAADAEVHRSWENLPETSTAGRFYYRVLKALDTQVVAPVFLWLTRHDKTVMPRAQRDAALLAIESWLVRRALLRATTRDYNNAMIDLLRSLERSGPGEAGDSTGRFLAAQSAESRYWPNDARVAMALANQRIYKTMTRPRLRMVLEALENDAHGPLGEGQAAPRGLTIEHVMPVAWREHWGLDIAGDAVAGQQRDDRVHTLGNLTLVNGKLNPTLSNRPWTDAETDARGLGTKGKRDYLLQHSQLTLNAALVYEHAQTWDEDLIRARTSSLVKRIIAMWPCAEDAEQTVGVSTPPPEELGPLSEEPWGVDDESVEAAARMWLAFNTTTRQLFQTLIDLAPERVAAPDLAQLIDLGSEALGIAGLLGWPGRVAFSLGRQFPVNWEEGEPSSYWIEESVAATFEAATQLAASEDFIAAQVGSPAEARRVSTRGQRRSVPAHILEVFASKPGTTELTVREIAAFASADYDADEISQGAIAAALNSGAVEGIDWVPASSPRRARRKR
jgi:hypothetical protein